MIPPVTINPWPIEAVIAKVSRKSTFSRFSRRQTPQAREAIGQPFHSISGTLIAMATGLAENARASETVGSVSTDGPRVFGGAVAGGSSGTEVSSGGSVAATSAASSRGVRHRM